MRYIKLNFENGCAALEGRNVCEVLLSAVERPINAMKQSEMKCQKQIETKYTNNLFADFAQVCYSPVFENAKKFLFQGHSISLLLNLTEMFKVEFVSFIHQVSKVKN